MATQFGYKAPTFGSFSGVRRPGVQSDVLNSNNVASALAGGSPLSGGSGYGGYTPYQHSPGIAQPQSYSPPTAGATNGYQHQTNPSQPQAPQAPTPGSYDLNTDPILQQIQALAGQSDQQAQAGALKQQEQLLLGYGDQNLAQQILGQNDPYVQAAGQNPTSVLAQLGLQHDRNTHNFTEGENNANLFYSGHRILGEQQGAQDYQAALAQAAQQANGGLDTIAGNLAAALGQNQQQRISGANDAYSRMLQQALAGGYGGYGGDGTTTPTDTTTAPTDTTAAGATNPYGATTDNQQQLLALAKLYGQLIGA